MVYPKLCPNKVSLLLDLVAPTDAQEPMIIILEVFPKDPLQLLHHTRALQKRTSAPGKLANLRLSFWDSLNGLCIYFISNSWHCGANKPEDCNYRFHLKQYPRDFLR